MWENVRINNHFVTKLLSESVFDSRKIIIILLAGEREKGRERRREGERQTERERQGEMVERERGGPDVSDQAGLNRGPLILIVFHCYFVSTFCEDRINTFLILILILTERETEKETGGGRGERGRQGEVGEINLLELFCVQTLGFLLYSKTIKSALKYMCLL